jgi:hypothetical protein
MGRDFLPRPDNEFRDWSANFIVHLLTGGEALGISLAQCERYEELHDSFVAAYLQSFNVSTRTRPVVEAKNSARKVLEREARMLARIIRANPNVTSPQRAGLRLSIDKPGKSARIGPPAVTPSIVLNATSGRYVAGTIKEHLSVLSRRPRGVAATMLFAFFGDVAPAWPTGWQMLAQVTRSKFTIPLGAEIEPKTRVWVCACYVNGKGETGPVSAKVCIVMADGVSLGLLAA